MQEAKGLIITGLVTLLILGGGIFLLSKGGNQATSTPAPVNPSLLVHSDSHQTNPGAKVTIVEFGDYRCPACDQAYPIIKQIIADYKEKVNIVFRNYAFLPDSSISETPTASTLAANAAECAADQNKFWEMHDYLYAHQPDESDISMYTVNTLTKDASSLGMDSTKFKTCLSNKTDNNRVSADLADGQALGITGTPTFFINSKTFNEAPSYSNFKAVIDPLLK